MTRQRLRQKKIKKWKKWLLVLPLGMVLFLLYLFGVIKVPLQVYADASKQVHLVNFGFQNYLYNAHGQKLYGFQQLNGKTVYLDPKTGAMAYGFHEIDGDYYDFAANGTDNAYAAYQQLAATSKAPNSGNAVIEKAVATGLKLVGKSPYDYGGGRDSASIAKNQFDCSSFAAWMYHLGGQDLVYQDAASTTLLAETGTTIDWNAKQRGDLLITPATDSTDEDHVAIYLGDNFILHDSLSTGGVAVSRLNQIIDPKVLGTMTWTQLFEQGTVQREVGN